MIYQIHNFNSLQLHQKAMFTDRNATFLVNLVDSDLIYSLYAYGSIYIEVVIHSTTKRLLDIIAFSEWDRLDKYFEHITLGDLFN